MKPSSPSIPDFPTAPATLLDLLRGRADRHPDHLAYRFLQDSESDIITISFAELDRRARAIGAWLESFGGSGERA